MYYTDVDGRQMLDGTAGLWCVNAGHGRREIAEAVERQLRTMDFAPSFQMGHPSRSISPRLARSRRADRSRLDRVFFTGSGSEAVDTALKIAIAYQRAIGQGTRTRIIGRERGYHGVGFGGISVGGLVNNRRVFPQMPADHMRHTLIRAQRLLEGPARAWRRTGRRSRAPGPAARRGDDRGRDRRAGAGSAGVMLPPKGYLQKPARDRDKHGILLIFDEVITGFGRLGTPFATDYFGVVPDLVTTAKGLTNGAIPMGAVFASRKVHDALMTGPETRSSCSTATPIRDIRSPARRASPRWKSTRRGPADPRRRSPTWQEALHSC
jgi:beta-alanine--pyruvate transaminase